MREKGVFGFISVKLINKMYIKFGNSLVLSKKLIKWQNHAYCHANECLKNWASSEHL